MLDMYIQLRHPIIHNIGDFFIHELWSNGTNVASGDLRREETINIFTGTVAVPVRIHF